MAATKTCDLADDCGDFSDEQLLECEQFTMMSFEDADQPFGFFVQTSETAQFQWSRGTLILFILDITRYNHDVGNGTTGQEGTGPPFDHTHFTPEGHYLYIASGAQVSCDWRRRC